MAESLDQASNFGNEHSPPPHGKPPATLLLKVLAVVAILAVVIAMLLPNVRFAGEAARRNQCLNNLKQIAIALQNYADVHHALPPAYTTDANGKPLHSWRTLILPFMEEQKLYESIDLTKPWDDPANAAACKTIISAYQCPSAPWEDGNWTSYLAVVTPNSCFQATEPRNLSDVTDATSQTLLVIEVDEKHAVPWMAPVDADEDLVLSLGGPNSRTAHPGGVQGAFVYGHVQFLSSDLPAAQRRALISIAVNDNASADDAE